MTTATPAPLPAVTRQPVKIRLHADLIERVRYWSEREGLSANEYMALAIEEKVGRANGDFDIPALGIQRMNQLIDEVAAMSTNLHNLETVVTSGFDSILGLTRGDSYLQDADDGELDEPVLPAGFGDDL